INNVTHIHGGVSPLVGLMLCNTNQPDTPPTFKSSNTRFSHNSVLTLMYLRSSRLLQSGPWQKAGLERLDLSRKGAAPLTAYYAQKENDYGNETHSRI
ncbi:hypothetical protein, partial [Profundibacter sp.]